MANGRPLVRTGAAAPCAVAPIGRPVRRPLVPEGGTVPQCPLCPKEAPSPSAPCLHKEGEISRPGPFPFRRPILLSRVPLT